MRSARHDNISARHNDCSTKQEGLLIDDCVVAALPAGSEVISAIDLKNSTRSTVFRLLVRLHDGSKAEFFLKSAMGDIGRAMTVGEFAAMSEIHQCMSELVPRPLACGKYRIGNIDTYFFLQEFLEMSNRMPDPDELCYQLAKLHRTSTSPNGSFGFHITTCQGAQPQMLTWEKTWTIFFAKLLAHVARIDLEVNGHWGALARLEQRIFVDVIPRVIGAVEREGRFVKPCLIHADLWEGNIGTSCKDGKVRVYDSGAFYAHNEMEIGAWRCHYNRIHDKTYTQTYLRYCEPSEPKDEWNDRNRMYSVYFNIIYSCNHKTSGRAIRQTAYDDMYYLIDKYAPFPDGEGPPRIRKEDYALLSSERDHNSTGRHH